MRSDEKPPETPKVDADMRLGLRLLAKLARIAEQASQSSGISLPQYRLLSEIASGPTRASVLAARLGISRPTLTSLVNGLEETGLLVRAPVESDRRGIALCVTAAGRGALSRAEAAIAERITGITSRTHLAGFTGLARHMSGVLAKREALPEHSEKETRDPADPGSKLRFPDNR